MLNNGHTQAGGRGLPLCSRTPRNLSLKNTDFVDMMILKNVCDLLFTQNQPMKSADVQHTGILKNKIKNLKSEEDYAF